MSNRRIRETAVVLPVAGLLLFLPPYMQVFDQDVFVLGIPLLHVYLFSVWLVGILLTGLVARRLVRQMDARDPESGGPAVAPHAPRVPPAPEPGAGGGEDEAPRSSGRPGAREAD